MGAEFARDIAVVSLDRVQREKQPGSDSRIAQSLGELHACDDFNLFLRQAVQLAPACCKQAPAHLSAGLWPRSGAGTGEPTVLLVGGVRNVDNVKAEPGAAHYSLLWLAIKASQCF